MAGTPNPSVEDLLALDDLVNGDIGGAQDEIVNRLRANLPGLVAAKNTAEDWIGANAMVIPSIGDIEIAPVSITADHRNQILVHIEEDTSPEGIGGAFRNTWTVTVYCVGELMESPQQSRTNWRRAECVKTVMRAFMSGVANDAGKLVWRSAMSNRMQMANDLDKNLSAVQVVFTLIQPPSYG